MTDENEPHQQPAEPPREQLSYTEKYAGTPYGRPAVAPAVPPPTTEPRARHRFGCFGVVLIFIGLYWLIPGVLGFVSTLNLWYSGKLFDQALPAGIERAVGTAVVISLVVSLAWILIGLKILIRPGRYSLGCTGVLALLSAITAAIWVSNIQDPPFEVLVAFGVYLTISVVFTLLALTAAQVVD